MRPAGALWVLPLAILLGASSAEAVKGKAAGEAAAISRAGALLRQAPLSPGLTRSASALLERAAARKGQLFHYAPVAGKSGVTIFDSRRIAGGFASYSVTVKERAPQAPRWDLQLIREDSSTRSLKDVARAAKLLPDGRTLEVRVVATNGKTTASYSVRERGTVVGRGDLKTLRGSQLGVPASYLQKLVRDLPY